MAGLAFLITEDSFVPDYLQDTEGEDAILAESFRKDRYAALYDLAFLCHGAVSPSLSFLGSLSSLFLDCLLHTPGLEIERERVILEVDDEDISALLDDAPYMIGEQFLSPEWVRIQFDRLLDVYRREISSFAGSVDLYLSSRRRDLLIPSRVYFHLVEHPDQDRPFAFMATYSTLDERGKVRHCPLSHARMEYGDDREKLASLIAVIRRLSAESPFIASLVRSGEIFHPIKLSADEAYSFLRETSLFESAGIICRVPSWWKRRGGSRIDLDVRGRSCLSRSVLLSVIPEMVYDGLRISEEDARELLSHAEGFLLFRGRWIEVNHRRLGDLLDGYRRQRDREADPITLLREEAGLEDGGTSIPIRFRSRSWLSECARSTMENTDIPVSFKGTLRGYQRDGFLWLTAMARLGLGACLADDMGLGKTVEMLAFLLHMKEEGIRSVLLIVPLSLLANWEHEIHRFAPSLDYLILYGKDSHRTDFPFLTISTYQMATKNEAVAGNDWDIVVLDEAQAIKNPGTAQSRRIKALRKHLGIAMTGTPIENNLSDLHSLFEFIDPGLLGSSDSFRRLACSGSQGRFSVLRRIVSPFILRRVKTDRAIISDLPEKIENDVMVALSKEQIVLYRDVVSQLEKAGPAATSFEEKGMILRTLLLLKEICNHPAQYTGDGDYSPARSGKFLALSDLAATLAGNRERVLVFTQFRTMVQPIDDLLASVFGKRGLSICGDTGRRQREERVELFQGGEIPYMVLSLRTAGVGLNLTAASSVIHFDRWWNPAVEDQATDRAYRIGQDRRVSVYRFIASDTIEERIAAMLRDKHELAENIIGEGSTSVLSLLSPDEIIEAMRFSGGTV